jgi:RHS repeat-associated protein
VPGNATRYTYTAAGNVAMVQGNTGDTLAIRSYDTWGRLVSSVSRAKVDIGSQTTSWQWTKDSTAYGVDNVAETTLSIKSGVHKWPTWTPQFDPPDTTNSVRTSVVLDSAGRVTGRINNRGKQTRITYDRLGRVVARRPWADSTAVRDSLVYDIAGNLKKVFTRRGVTITHAYDSRNRDTLTVIPGVGNVKHAYGGPQDQVTRVWLASAVDSIGGVNGEVRYGYDSRGRLRADTAYTGSTPRVTTYAYDTYERPDSTVDALGTWRVRYETVRGLADTLVTPMADTIVTVVDANGQLESRTIRSNGAKVQYTASYTDALELMVDGTQLVGPNGGYTAGGFHRVVDDTSGVALSPNWEQQLGTGTSTQYLTDSTDYDGWGRLTGWQGAKDGVIQAAEGYTFDALGNVADTVGTWVYDAGTDRLTQRTSGSTTHHYGYDRAGNLVVDSVPSGVVWHYGYDAADRLASVRRNGVLIARYGYDVLGRRIVKRVYSSVTGGTVGYLRMVYSGSDVSFETDSAGAIGLRYTWGSGTDQLLAIQDAAGNHYYATTDRLGSVRSLAKRDGTWLLTRRWDPYGNEMTRDSSASFTWGNQLRYGWTGREYDAETGLSYHRARYYSPTQRRFTQEDPIGYDGGPNLYAYVGGSPLERRDPYGLQYMTVCGYQGYNYYWRSGRITHGYEYECHEVWVPSAPNVAGGGGGGPASPSPSTPDIARRLDPPICDTIRNSPGFRQTVHDLRTAQAEAVAGGLGYLPETGGATDADFNLIEPIRIGIAPADKKWCSRAGGSTSCSTMHKGGGVVFGNPSPPDNSVWLVHLHIDRVRLNGGDLDGLSHFPRAAGVISVLDDGFNVARQGQDEDDQVHCRLK